MDNTSFDFPDTLLSLARKVSLADLMDSPLTQCWAVSMICNAVGTESLRSGLAAEMTEEDDLLELRLRKIGDRLPADERNALFSQCGKLITLRKEFMHREVEVK